MKHAENIRDRPAEWSQWLIVLAIFGAVGLVAAGIYQTIELLAPIKIL